MTGMILTDRYAFAGRDALTCLRGGAQGQSGHLGPPVHPPCALVVVDDPASRHGLRMARVLQPTTPVIWIPPDLDLPTHVLATRARVITLPLRVRGGYSQDDPFTAALVHALWRLRARGCLVYVAQGPHPNPLAEVGIAVRAPPDGSHRSASEACVAVAEFALLRSKPPRRERHG